VRPPIPSVTAFPIQYGALIHPTAFPLRLEHFAQLALGPDAYFDGLLL
jgi:hypothetical protein